MSRGFCRMQGKASGISRLPHGQAQTRSEQELGGGGALLETQGRELIHTLGLSPEHQGDAC